VKIVFKWAKIKNYTRANGLGREDQLVGYRSSLSTLCSYPLPLFFIPLGIASIHEHSYEVNYRHHIELCLCDCACDSIGTTLVSETSHGLFFRYSLGFDP
jgi:hypothetical protein